MRARTTNTVALLLLPFAAIACSLDDTSPVGSGAGAGGILGTGAAGNTVGGTGGLTGSTGGTDTGMTGVGAGAGTGGGAGAAGAGAGTGDMTAGRGGTAGISAAGTGGDPALPTPGDCVGDWMAGTYPADFITGGGASSLPPIGGRSYAVHVPTGYDCHLPTPIVFCLHGLGQSGFSFCVNGTSTPKRMGGMVAKADEEGFIVVMSSGLGPSAADVQVVRDIFANLETHLNVDHKRVYATGHSFGGYLSFLLACSAADLFTAVAPNAGSLSGGCKPSQPISVLASHGTADGIVPYSSLAPAITTLAAANGCSPTGSPATVPVSGGDTTCVTHTGCKDGVEVTGCTIEGGGHTWFGDPSCGTGAPGACGIVGANSSYYVNTDVACEFLRRLSR